MSQLLLMVNCKRCDCSFAAAAAAAVVAAAAASAGLQRKVEHSPYPSSTLSPPSGSFPVQDLQRRVHLPFTVHVIPHNTAPTAMSLSL